MSWKIFHQVIYQYQQVHPDWIFVRHEDLCQDFISGFENLYSQLALPWSTRVQERIRQYCRVQEKLNLGSKVHILSRNSVAIPQSWKQSLSQQEVSRIREITQDVADLFYDSNSWL